MLLCMDAYGWRTTSWELWNLSAIFGGFFNLSCHQSCRFFSHVTHHTPQSKWVIFQDLLNLDRSYICMFDCKALCGTKEVLERIWIEVQPVYHLPLLPLRFTFFGASKAKEAEGRPPLSHLPCSLQLRLDLEARPFTQYCSSCTEHSQSHLQGICYLFRYKNRFKSIRCPLLF